MERTVNARDTRRRMRVCSGGFLLVMSCCHHSHTGPDDRPSMPMKSVTTNEGSLSVSSASRARMIHRAPSVSTASGDCSRTAVMAG